MKFLMTALFALLVLASSPVDAAERSSVLDIENMTLALCPITVSKAINSVSGVASVKVSLDEKTATVTYDDSVADLETIADASTFAGYPATPRTAQ